MGSGKWEVRGRKEAGDLTQPKPRLRIHAKLLTRFLENLHVLCIVARIGVELLPRVSHPALEIASLHNLLRQDELTRGEKVRIERLAADLPATDSSAQRTPTNARLWTWLAMRWRSRAAGRGSPHMMEVDGVVLRE